MAASPDELKDALKGALSKSGVLSEVKARIRAEVHSVLLDSSKSPPPLSNENLIINELIREYLIFNGYRYTESVLMAETFARQLLCLILYGGPDPKSSKTGQPEFSLGREFLQHQLNVKPKRDSASVKFQHEYKVPKIAEKAVKTGALYDLPFESPLLYSLVGHFSNDKTDLKEVPPHSPPSKLQK